MQPFPHFDGCTTDIVCADYKRQAHIFAPAFLSLRSASQETLRSISMMRTAHSGVSSASVIGEPGTWLLSLLLDAQRPSIGVEQLGTLTAGARCLSIPYNM